LNTEVKIIST
jgi:hypothetical protein